MTDGQHFALQQRDMGGGRKEGADLFCKGGSRLWLRCDPFHLEGERCCTSVARGGPAQGAGGLVGWPVGWPTGQATPRLRCGCG